MKRLLSIILIFALVSCVAMAQRALMIRHADGVTDAVSTAAIDSLEFSDDGLVLKIAGKDGKLVEIGASGISLIVVTGGIAVTAGGRMGSSGTSSIGSSTQGYYLGASPSSYSSTKYYTLCNTSGEAICTYKFAGNVSNSLGLLTAPNLGKGSITIKTGTEKPTACDVSVNDVFFINPTVTTTATAATVTAK